MEEENERKSTCKAMSPGSMHMPTMPNWDIGQSMSPYIPPDMNSKLAFDILTIAICKRISAL